MTPPFTAHKIKNGNFRTVINSCVRRLLLKLEQKRSSGEAIDISYYMKSVTLDIIGQSALEMDDTDAYEGKDKSKMHRIVGAIMEDKYNFLVRWTLYLPFLKKVIYFAHENFTKNTLSIVQHLNGCIKNYYKKQKLVSKFKVKEEKRKNIFDFLIKQKELGKLNENEVLG